MSTVSKSSQWNDIPAASLEKLADVWEANQIPGKQKYEAVQGSCEHNPP